MNTLFSCIAGRGQLFTNNQWRTCLCDMVFVVYDKVTVSIDSNTASARKEIGTRKSRYVVSVHHSRDSAGKQWVTTQSLVLRGLSRVLRIFFPKLLATTEDDSTMEHKQDNTPWFDDAWNKVLSYAFDASTQVGGRDTLELRTAGSELLVLCAQLSCKQGIHAAITPARVGTNMEVVNGALRSVRSPDKNESNNRNSSRHSHSVVTETWRENLFLDAFDVLDSFREHLESDASNHHESGLHYTLEPTQVQVLSKFAEDMGRLYDCCKTVEFAEERNFESVQDFEKLMSIPRPTGGESDPLVSRFVQIIATVALGSASSPDARFLSQAQKSCMDILRSMASDGSPEAFLTLTELAGETFFVERDENGKAKHGVDVLEHEASTVLQEEFSTSRLSHEARVLVTHRMLTIFLKESLPSSATGISCSYKLLVPLITQGLGSAKEMQMIYSKLSSSKLKLLDSLWDKTTITLNHMLTPKMDGTALLMPHSIDLIEIAAVISTTTPPRRREEICAILSSGASKCLALARDYPSQRNETLRLFTACFSGVCRVDPKNRSLKAIAEQVLVATTLAISKIEPKQDDQFLKDVDVQACLMICRAMQEVEGVDGVVISIFPHLCQLVAVDFTELRKAVGDVLSKVDVGRVIAESDALRLSAEERAIVAEIKVVELTKELEKLHTEKEALERQLALI